MGQKYSAFLGEFDILTCEELKNGNGRASRALFLLCQIYEKQIAPIFDELEYQYDCHKCFRQIDVTDGGKMDMVFWNLFHESDSVWIALGKAGYKELG